MNQSNRRGGEDAQGRIDVHHHIEWETYVSTLERNSIKPAHGAGYPDWSIEKTLATMDENNIRAALLSVSSPGVYFKGTTFAVDLARRCNDYTAGLVQAHPDRLGFFAILPMPLVEASVKEAIRSLDTLKADGIVLLASAGDKFLGDRDFEELMAELDKRNAVVFIHPNIHSTSENLGLAMPGFLTEFLFDTTRAVTNLIYTGTVERYPRIRWILAHAGGTVPFIAWRLALSNMDPEFLKAAPRGFIAYLKEFYYDTALSTSSFAMAPLLELVGPSRIVFGSDYPFCPALLVAKEVDDLRRLPLFDEKVREAVNDRNATELFPRFGTSAGSLSAGGLDSRAKKIPFASRLAVSAARRMMKM
jgi:6-methylsalicylate decarboxylase